MFLLILASVSQTSLTLITYCLKYIYDFKKAITTKTK